MPWTRQLLNAAAKVHHLFKSVRRKQLEFFYQQLC